MLSKQIYNKGKVTFTIGGQCRMNTSASASSRSLTKKTTSSSADSEGDISGSGFSIDTRFDMILADDRMSALKIGGQYRLLEEDEYRITRFTGPVDSRGYSYDIYISNVGYDSSVTVGANPSVTPAAIARMGDFWDNTSGHKPANSDYIYYGSGNTSVSNIINFGNSLTSQEGFEGFTDGVKALYIIVRGFEGNYSISYKLDVEFDLDYNSELLKEENERVSPEGVVTNSGYMRAFKHDEHSDVFTISDGNYSDDSFNNGYIKPLDRASNGKLIYHTLSGVYLRDLQTFLTSGTEVQSTKRPRSEGDGYKIDITTTGTLKADDSLEGIPTELEKFALYVNIPDLLTIDSRLDDVRITGCKGTDILGKAVDNSVFEQNVSYRLINNAGGRFIAAEFDFSSSPLDLTSLKLEIPARILYNDFRASSTKQFLVTSYTKLNEEGAGKIFASNGATVDQWDFDGNNNFSEPMASSSKGKSYTTLAEDWQDTVEKFVKSYRDESWNYNASGTSWLSTANVNARSSQISETANLRSTYQYRLSLNLGLPTSDIMFDDVLDSAEGTQWKGKLKSLDFTFARNLGLVPTVYYLTNDNPVQYSETELDIDAGAYENNLESAGFTESPVSENIWTAPENVRSVAVHLSTEDLPGKNITTKQIYFLVNMQAPDDTTADADDLYGKLAKNRFSVHYTSQTSVYPEFTIDANNASVGADISNVINDRKKGEVILKKIAGENVTVGSDTYTKDSVLPGAVFKLFTMDGEKVFVKANGGKYTVCDESDSDKQETMTTDSSGLIDVEGIGWGAYYFEEVQAPQGFALADKVRFTVNATSCLAVQELECSDFAMKCLITIDKVIDEKLEVFGTPSFTFRIKKLGASDNVECDYTTMITLGGNSRSGSATVQVPAGTYTVEEVPVIRYQLTKTQYVTEDGKTTVPAASRFIDSDNVDVKPGGAYLQKAAAVKRIDDVERFVYFTDGSKLPIDDITNLDREIFRFLESVEYES